MKQKLLAIVFIFFSALWAPSQLSASHIVGGEMFYECLGNDQYKITLKVYRDCYNGIPPLDNPAAIGIFRGNGTLAGNPSVFLAADSIIPNDANNPCLIIPPNICVEEGTYVFTVTLPPTPGGYTIAYQRCCRNITIANLFDPSNTGTTIFQTIPDTSLAICNSSPFYDNYPPTVICVNYPLIFDHSATDPDGDSLVYSLCAPYIGATALNPQPPTPSAPPYANVTYQAGYSASDPLATLPPMSIDPVTGILTVTPDAVGQFVVGICVSEYRNGVLLGVHLRDFQFNVTQCTLPPLAAIPSVLNGCDGFSFDFPNYSIGANTFFWDFGIPGATNDTSTLMSPHWTYSDTGIYTVTLYANPGTSCADTATMQVYVYPTFTGSIVSPESCAGFPVQFLDSTTTTYGVINSWNWTFANLGNSSTQNPVFTFDSSGTFLVTLVVTNTMGCIDTVTTLITIHPQPIAFAAPDSTICYLDTIQLYGSGIGNYTWTPSYGLSSNTVQNPFASPDVDTEYILHVENQWGCYDEDTILINVVNSVTAAVTPDTVICPGDFIQLNASGGWVYSWSPPTGLSNPAIPDPIATPPYTILYTVTLNIGSCYDSATVNVGVKPFPQIAAGPDQTICVGDTVMIEACCGSNYAWTPGNYLSDAFAAQPLAFPPFSTIFHLEATDTNSCPLVVYDDVTVNVIFPAPLITTPDTLIYLGTSAELYSVGAVYYEWDPKDFLSDGYIYNPVASPVSDITYHVFGITEDGCKVSDSLTITVVVDPLVIFPNVYTPNGDGTNDYFAPIVLGYFDPDLFNVFNRWGQLVFQSHEISPGWDGKHKGREEEVGTYVYYLRGRSMMTGKEYFLKGNVILLR